jgi:hypothetical protein
MLQKIGKTNPHKFPKREELPMGKYTITFNPLANPR